MDGNSKVETINELKLWLEGKFDLIKETNASTAKDVSAIKEKLHKLSGSVHELTLLNIPEKLKAIATDIEKHDKHIQNFIDDKSEQKGALKAFRALYIVGGAAIGVIATIGLKAWELLA